ncbi:MAG: thioredoxin domain-containing protein [Bacteroidota bacterium]
MNIKLINFKHHKLSNIKDFGYARRNFISHKQSVLYTIRYAVFFLLTFACQQTNSTAQSHQYTNELIRESSPYLLQHAHNPVNWYPWGEKALQKAKEEDKLLIISVGYAACHWCHVMEHESFEDTTVANLMNKHFVAIKVDREERPDIDNVYMSACHLATNKNCGWPLNAFALPDGRPVWAGTYFPKKEWVKVLEYFLELYEKEPEKLATYAEQLTEGIQSVDQIEIKEKNIQFTDDQLVNWTEKFVASIDKKKGGRQGAPKFPMPNNYEYLLQYAYQKKNETAKKAAIKTLDNMAFGGIYDHLGGGFARYSTDADWKVPHFEKMLYDNGQLVSLYAQAYQWTKAPLYKQVIEKTLSFVARELTDDNGGFYSSLDADSEGEEGKFYVWTAEEIASVLKDEKQAALFNAYYEVEKDGNWEDTNVLYRKKLLADIATEFDVSKKAAQTTIDDAKKKLLAARAKRERPGTDDKILTAWNALMLKGYVDAYKALGQEVYLETALKNADFLLKNMLQADHRLLRNHKDGKSVINAFLDDYALTIQAFAGLYEVTFDEKWLYHAKDLTEYTLRNFYDTEKGFFNYTSKLDPPLVAQKIETSDNVIPASNSMMARNLHLLGLYLYEPSYLEQAKQMLSNISATIESAQNPSFYSNWLQLYLDMLQEPYEIAIVGVDYPSLQKEMLTHYLPNAILLGGASEGTLELLEGKLQEGDTYIYVCQNKVCKFPVQTVSEALKLMK